ncbi:hypothetical protein [Candidatus Nanohalobium constans]|uniref:Uncharacterized protein n=1 Tax=Candidatus Nanohalobium constans TaxID=2565781 RepID=A0A5Q0UH03_9ARCH|nr:hypothetical protein [Candidatus Nanohalobium constans]QGA80490.1 hypothetical protein LC1Nh_0596 [Candidatus Nanohalobium constans]
MEHLINELSGIKGVKNVKKYNQKVLEVNLFSREVPGSEAEEISGDLRKISQNIRNTLEEHRKKGKIQNWEWMNKPEKQYEETRLGTDKIKDRKEKGHKPAYYRISVKK